MKFHEVGQNIVGADRSPFALACVLPEIRALQALEAEIFSSLFPVAAQLYTPTPCLTHQER